MEKVDILIAPVHIITVDAKRQEITDGMAAIKNGRFVYVGKNIPGRFESEKVINAEGKYLFPGFVNPHVHLFQALLKGLGRDKALIDWLNVSVRKALPKIDAEDALAAATAGCMENLRSGVTTLLDYMYCHGTNLYTLDEAVLEAFEKTGIRGYLVRAHTEVKGMNCPVEETEDQYFEILNQLIPKLKNKPRTGLFITPGMIWNHTVEGFKKTREYADKHGVGITMHTIETLEDDVYSQEHFGAATMSFLDAHGVLGPDFLAVHCVQASDEDIRIMAKNDVKVIHCPVANMILASGFAPIKKMKQAGLTIGLATDGAGSNDSQNYLETLKFAALIHKAVERDPAFLSAYEVLEMATIDGAKCMGLEKEIGSIETGKRADFFIYNPMRSLTSVALHDVVSNLMYCSELNNIETVVVEGDILIADGQFTRMDEWAAADHLQRRAQDLMTR